MKGSAIEEIRNDVIQTLNEKARKLRDDSFKHPDKLEYQPKLDFLMNLLEYLKYLDKGRKIKMTEEMDERINKIEEKLEEVMTLLRPKNRVCSQQMETHNYRVFDVNMWLRNKKKDSIATIIGVKDFSVHGEVDRAFIIREMDQRGDTSNHILKSEKIKEMYDELIIFEPGR